RGCCTPTTPAPRWTPASMGSSSPTTAAARSTGRWPHSTARPTRWGAGAGLCGRPYIYGLGLGGQAGVEHVLRCLLAELDVTMALTGHRRFADLSPDVVGDAPD